MSHVYSDPIYLYVPNVSDNTMTLLFLINSYDDISLLSNISNAKLKFKILYLRVRVNEHSHFGSENQSSMSMVWNKQLVLIEKRGNWVDI